MSNEKNAPAAVPAGAVFVISAPSGAGKTTLCRRLVSGLDGIDFSVSFTTRPARSGESDGVDYHFVTPEEFERRSREGEFVERAVVDGHHYATSSRSVLEATSGGRDILLDIDTQGAESVRRAIPGSVLIFVLPPGREALRRRLGERGTEREPDVERRLGLAAAEIVKAPLYDYVIVNDDLEAAYDELRAIVIAERCRRTRRAPRVREAVREFEAGS